jgi:hypothetical protein
MVRISNCLAAALTAAAVLPAHALPSRRALQYGDTVVVEQTLVGETPPAEDLAREYEICAGQPEGEDGFLSLNVSPPACRGSFMDAAASVQQVLS